MLVRPCLLERKKYCSKDCQHKGQAGLRRAPDTEFKPGHRPASLLPVGTEVASKGYMRVKVAEPNIWRPRSHLVWEAAHGKPLPKGWIVRRKDGDTLNDEIENLVAMSRGQNIRIMLEDPTNKRKQKTGMVKASKTRWDAHREQKKDEREDELKQYDTCYWELENAEVN
jgi:hypothetical protein